MATPIGRTRKYELFLVFEDYSKELQIVATKRNAYLSQNPVLLSTIRGCSLSTLV